MNLLQLNSSHVGDVAKVGLIVALIALVVCIIYITGQQINEWFTNFYILSKYRKQLQLEDLSHP